MAKSHRRVQVGQHDVTQDGQQRRDVTAGLPQHDPGLVHLALGEPHAGLAEYESHREAGIRADDIGRHDPLQGAPPVVGLAGYLGA